MKTFAHASLVLASLLAFMFIAPRANAQAPSFEGTATWSMLIPQMDDEKHEMTINIKGEKIETEMDMGAQGGIKTYVDRGKKKIYIVMSAMKSGWSMDMPSDSAAKGKLDSLDLKPTGQKATIAGHPSEEYVIPSHKGDVTLWMAGDFPKDVRDAFHHAMSSQRTDASTARAVAKLAEKGLVPVKMVVKDGGDVQASIELVKLEPKKLDDGLFETPKDIKFSPVPTGAHGMN